MSTQLFTNSALIGPAATSHDRVAFDNLLRRELKVADPNDAYAVADALMRRYQDDPRARAIQQEAQGLPFLQTVTAGPPAPSAPTASDSEWKQAVDDIERDLRELTTSALLKDVTAELAGWTEAIRSALREGASSARFGLDPHQRDKTFAIRRQLGDYARIARLSGAMTHPVNHYYRQLAKSLDEAAAVLLVRLGEALGNAGFSGGRFLLQAPYSQLQQRRDAVLYALRVLAGAPQHALGPNDWPRGLDAYRQLFDKLEAEGQGDLRSLLVEGELTRIMDELIQRAANGTPDGLRAVGATAQVDLARFRRLILVGARTVRPESPALTSFLQSLQLFLDGFTSAGGFRLLRIARPPILLYGLYGSQGLDPADGRLLELTRIRSSLADELDCIMDCDCRPEHVRLQVVADAILYGLDRVIDLYALGNTDFGRPECRASAYAYTIMAALALPGNATTTRPTLIEQLAPDLEPVLISLVDSLAPFSNATDFNPQPARPPRNFSELTTFTEFRSQRNIESRSDEIGLHFSLEQKWLTLLQGLVQSCVSQDVVSQTLRALFGNALALNLQGRFLASNRDNVDTPQGALQPFTLGPNGGNRVVFVHRPELGVDTAPTIIHIPPHIETAMDGLVNDVLPDGFGRL